MLGTVEFKKLPRAANLPGMPTSPLPILIADTSTHQWTLPADCVMTRCDAAAAAQILETQACAIVLAHAGEAGETLLAHIASRFPHVLRVLMAPIGDAAAAVRAINELAVFGFLPTPVSDEVLSAMLARAGLHYREQQHQVETMAELRATVTRLHDQIAMVEQSSVVGMSGIDPHTNLWDRHILVERLEDENNRLARYKIPFGLVAVSVRPELEVAAATVLQDFVRRVDVCARFEPGRFVVICPSTAPAGVDVVPGRMNAALVEAGLSGIAITAIAVKESAPVDELLARLFMAAQKNTDD